MKRESLNTPIQPSHCQSRSGVLDHTSGTYSHVGMMNYPRFPIKDSMEFQGWKLNFRTEVCMRTAEAQVTMMWIKEVEVAKSIDELVTLRSVTGDDDMLDAMIASALKNLINTQSTFRTRVSVEEQRAQNSDRFLRGRQIAYRICKYVRATGAFENSTRTCRLGQYDFAE